MAGLAWAWCLCAVAQCDGNRYRYRVFSEVEVTYGVIYGANVGSSGANEELDMDVYLPAGDDVSDRPVVILAHGGFFLAGSNDGVDVVPLCEDLARMGYVAASISYRLGIDNVFDLETSLQESVLRGVHDAKAAVRYFRKTHAEQESTPIALCSAVPPPGRSLPCMRPTSTTWPRCPTSLI